MKSCKQCGHKLEKDRVMVCHKCAPEPKGMKLGCWKIKDKRAANSFKEWLCWMRMPEDKRE